VLPALSAAAPALTRRSRRIWFQLGVEGRAASVLIAPTAIVDDLRKAIKAELVDTLRGVDAFRLLLGATADSRTS
jgi:hypothetical protein